jgi:hypothetical protein
MIGKEDLLSLTAVHMDTRFIVIGTVIVEALLSSVMTT